MTYKKDYGLFLLIFLAKVPGPAFMGNSRGYQGNSG